MASVGKPFVLIFRHLDEPHLSFSPRRRCPRLTPERVLVADHHNQTQDVGEQASRDCELGKLESVIATVANDFGDDLD